MLHRSAVSARRVAGEALPVYPSVAFTRTLAALRRFARDRYAPICLEGEPGTGKTTLARFIHDESPRRASPFQSLLLSAVEDSLCASELFGHTAGAFTDARHPRAGQFVSAHGGTLFLDEIGKASPHVQQRLLRAVESGEIRPVGADREVKVDVRIVAATNVPLHELVARGAFLPDLYARLDVFRVVLPALRERRADIPLLARRCLAFHAERSGHPGQPWLAPELVAALQTAPWPNNVRQLSATVHRLLLEADGAEELTLAHCQGELAYLRRGRAGDRRETPSAAHIEHALAVAGSVAGAARLLGVHRTTLHRHLRRGEAPRCDNDTAR